jgi:nicotinate-nucleotide adenylyltransferase
MKRVGIFSGTFDPVHKGHIRFALAAREACKLDKVFFLVEPRPRRKQGVKAFEHRVAMVQLAIKKHPDFSSIVLEQARFTPHETLPVLEARFKGAELFMLMGEDMLDHLADWPHVDSLIHAVTFVVGARHRSEREVRRIIQALQKTRGLSLKAEVFHAADSEVASSKIRTALRKGQTSSQIEPAVQRYIQKHQLYSTSGE